jgi:hypothetical protein
MERPIAVITTGIRSSPKKILVGSHVMALRDVHCVRLIRKTFFLGWGNYSGFIG